MKLCIPRLDQVLTLEKDWSPTLKKEYRNNAFIEAHGVKPKFKAGHQLKMERLYLRRSGVNAHNFDSVTFRSLDEPKGRFFVGFDQANGLEYSTAPVLKEAHVLLERQKGRNYLHQRYEATSLAALTQQLNKWRVLHRIMCDEPEVVAVGPAPVETKVPPGDKWDEAWERGYREYWAACRVWNDKMDAAVKAALKRHGWTVKDLLFNLPNGWEYRVTRSHVE